MRLFLKVFVFIGFFTMLLTNLLLAQNERELLLIPSPQKVEFEKGEYKIPAKIRIVISNDKKGDNKFAAGQLIELLSKELYAKNVTLGKTGNLFLGIPGENKEIDAVIKKEKIVIPTAAGDEGYVLKVFNKGIIIAANNSKGIFYGVQTLKQLLTGNRIGNSLPCLTIYDWPALKLRGWMDDISRGPIPTVDFLKKEIRTMAEFKQNYFTLYTEHVFKLKKYPDIAPQDGISAEEIAELTVYAEKYHIEIVGNEQSFGHMAKILSIPFYYHLKENSDVLNPSIEDTYKFLADEYSEIAPAYKSKLFNINCDETYGLGTTTGSKRMADSIGEDGVYAYHINRINEILKKYGKSIMMWGDIAVNNKSIIGKLPKDMIILSWGYHAAESFDNAILPFKNSGFRFMVAPGVSCWSEVWPNMSNAAINISNYVRDGYKLGAMGMMNTAWDDDGENLFNYNWHGLVWGAECSWKPASPAEGDEAVEEREQKLKQFNKAFDRLFYGCKNLSAMDVLLKFDAIRKIPVKNIVRDDAVWSSMLDLYPDNVDSIAVENNIKVKNAAIDLINGIESLRKDVTRNDPLLDQASFAAKRILFTAHKNLVRVDIANAMKNRNAANKKALIAGLNDLLSELFSLKKEYVELWGRENRGWWLDKVLAKYDRLGDQILNLDKNIFIRNYKDSQDRQMIELSTLFNDKDIYYTINGEAPSLRSDKYEAPFELKGSSLLRALVIDNGEKFPVTEKYYLNHKAIGKLLKLNSQYSKYNPAYSGGGDNALVDGLTGSDNFADGHWQGFQGKDLNVVLDFGRKTEISKFNISCLQNSYSWILLPAKVELYASDDGTNFNLIKEIPNSVDPKAEGTIIHNFKADFTNTSLRYLKVICKYPGDLPSWHHAAGNPSFIFADEIVVE